MNTKVYTKGRINKYDATGIFDGKGIIVKKGSLISDRCAKNVNPVVIKKRMDHSIVSDDFILLQDVWFRSSSTAATFVSGNISNGLKVWKVKSGLELGLYLEKKENNNG